MKKRGFGEGKRNGAGGKQTEGESIEQTAKREFLEETGVEISIDNIVKQGVLHFYRPDKPEWDQAVHVFVGISFVGEPKETEEMIPKWRDINAIPYNMMREDDIVWLPRLIAGELFEYEFIFDKNNKIYSSKIIL